MWDLYGTLKLTIEEIGTSLGLCTYGFPEPTFSESKGTRNPMLGKGSCVHRASFLWKSFRLSSWDPLPIQIFVLLGFKGRQVHHKLKHKQKTLVMLKSEVAVPPLTACRGRHGLMNSALVEELG